jgi:hypothetical protein
MYTLQLIHRYRKGFLELAGFMLALTQVRGKESRTLPLGEGDAFSSVRTEKAGRVGLSLHCAIRL